ncbi:MAG TPA: hypothetical protein VED46_07805 [Alphaproteobacteria bacterium]|nr:hypothetical protein [Alphaproteobacteria bacterium]
MSVDTGAMREFLSQRLAKMRCAACGEQAWEAPQPNTVRILLQTSDPDRGEELRPVHPFLPAVWVSCASCGHILLFAHSAVQSWWRETLERKSREEGWNED